MPSGDWKTDAVQLSGSTNGKPINITATTSGGAQTIHTASSTETDFVTVYANTNDTSTARDITLMLGGTTVPDNVITGPVSMTPKRGLVKILENHPVEGGEVLYAYASSANRIQLHGRVRRLEE